MAALAAGLGFLVGWVGNLLILLFGAGGEVPGAGVPATGWPVGGGAPAIGVLAVGMLFWALLSTVVVGGVSYRRAVGKERFWSEVRGMPGLVRTAFTSDAGAAWATVLWGVAVAVLLSGALGPWVSLTVAVGLAVSAQSYLGRLLVTLARSVARTVLGAAGRKVRRIPSGAVGVVLGMSGTITAVLFGILVRLLGLAPATRIVASLVLAFVAMALALLAQRRAPGAVALLLLGSLLLAPPPADAQDQELLDCLCRCNEPEGGQFRCSYDTEDPGWSPSCRDLTNGPCICRAYGCFRYELPTGGECYDACMAAERERTRGPGLFESRCEESSSSCRSAMALAGLSVAGGAATALGAGLGAALGSAVGGLSGPAPPGGWAPPGSGSSPPSGDPGPSPRGREDRRRGPPQPPEPQRRPPEPPARPRRGPPPRLPSGATVEPHDPPLVPDTPHPPEVALGPDGAPLVHPDTGRVLPVDAEGRVRYGEEWLPPEVAERRVAMDRQHAADRAHARTLLDRYAGLQERLSATTDPVERARIEAELRQATVDIAQDYQARSILRADGDSDLARSYADRVVALDREVDARTIERLQELGMRRGGRPFGADADGVRDIQDFRHPTSWGRPSMDRDLGLSEADVIAAEQRLDAATTDVRRVEAELSQLRRGADADPDAIRRVEAELATVRERAQVASAELVAAREAGRITLDVNQAVQGLRSELERLPADSPDAAATRRLLGMLEADAARLQRTEVARLERAIDRLPEGHPTRLGLEAQLEAARSLPAGRAGQVEVSNARWAELTQAVHDDSYRRITGGDPERGFQHVTHRGSVEAYADPRVLAGQTPADPRHAPQTASVTGVKATDASMAEQLSPGDLRQEIARGTSKDMNRLFRELEGRSDIPAERIETLRQVQQVLDAAGRGELRPGQIDGELQRVTNLDGLTLDRAVTMVESNLDAAIRWRPPDAPVTDPVGAGRTAGDATEASRTAAETRALAETTADQMRRLSDVPGARPEALERLDAMQTVFERVAAGDIPADRLVPELQRVTRDGTLDLDRALEQVRSNLEAVERFGDRVGGEGPREAAAAGATEVRPGVQEALARTMDVATVDRYLQENLERGLSTEEAILLSATQLVAGNESLRAFRETWSGTPLGDGTTSMVGRMLLPQQVGELMPDRAVENLIGTGYLAGRGLVQDVSEALATGTWSGRHLEEFAEGIMTDTTRSAHDPYRGYGLLAQELGHYAGGDNDFLADIQRMRDTGAHIEVFHEALEGFRDEVAAGAHGAPLRGLGDLIGIAAELATDRSHAIQTFGEDVARIAVYGVGDGFGWEAAEITYTAFRETPLIGNALAGYEELYAGVRDQGVGGFATEMWEGATALGGEAADLVGGWVSTVRGWF